MERKDFLQGIGLLGISTLLPAATRAAGKKEEDFFYSCTLTPGETAGPYPYPGTVPAAYTSSPLYRDNLIGDLPAAGGGGTLTSVVYNGTTFPGRTTGNGIGLQLTLTVQNEACTPISDARVDIWHCDKRGYYSAYNSSQNGGDWSAYSFLRGIQTTDSNGQVRFTTIFPSWYIPRAIHFHIQVYYAGTLVLTSQLGVADAIGQTVNNTSSANSYGRNYTYTNATDMVFSDGFTSQLITFNSDSNNTRGYIGTGLLTVSAILPLKLLSFNALVENKKATLKWVSENEDNLSRFEVESAADGRQFTKLGAVAASNQSGTHTYSFSDQLNSGLTYYRLKMIDADGRFTYSAVLLINGSLFREVQVYPNPAKDVIQIQHQQTDHQTRVKILNTAGLVIAEQQLPAAVTVTNFDVHAFPPGTYLLVIQSSTRQQTVHFTKL